MAVPTSEAGKVGTLTSKTSLDQQTKKILRYLDDTSKRLDDYTGRCNNVFELFSSAGAPMILRSRLRDLVWRALKTPDSALEIGNKALELGWRKIYYEPIHVARRLKKRGPWSKEDASYIESHLVNGIGHYHAVITFLCDTPSLRNENDNGINQHSLYNVVESRESIQNTLVSNYGFDLDGLDFSNTKRISETTNSSSEKYLKWKKVALHRCFTSLGDLSRYRIEFEELHGARGNKISATSVARMYYNDALLIDPQNGMPFNQLAALATNQNFGLDSVYYYLRCLASSNPFKGCEANLQSLFQQNTNKLNKIETRHVDDQSEDNISANEACERSVIYLLRLVQELLFEEGTKRLSQFCQKALQHVQKCLYLPHSQENDKSLETEQNSVLSNVNQSLSSDVASKMVVILLLVASRLKNEKDDIKHSMIRAYLLALFSHFVTKLLGDAYFCVFGPESMSDLFLNEADQIKTMEQDIENEAENGEKCDQDSDGDQKESNADNNDRYSHDRENDRKKPKRKKFHDVLRRKRLGKNRDSDSDGSSNLSYSSHESIGSTSDDSDEDSDGNLRYLARKRKTIKQRKSECEEGKGKLCLIHGAIKLFIIVILPNHIYNTLFGICKYFRRRK